MNICPICSSEDTFLYMKGIFDSATTSVIECRNCGLQFLNPMMTDAEEAEYYRNYYKSQEKRDYKKFSLKDIQNRALKHYEEYFNIYSDLINGKKRILEIGSGSGGFLQFIKKHSSIKHVVSVEKSESNLEFLKNPSLNTFSDFLFYDEISRVPATEKFDLIVAFGVLEHVRDSISFLNSFLPLMECDGSLAFLIPNKKTPLVDIYGLEEFKKFTYMLQHCYVFSEQSLSILGNKCGLKVEAFNYIQVWSLDNHLSWLKNRKPQDFSAFTDLLSKETIDSYNKDLISKKMTDLMLVVYKKNHHELFNVKELC